MEGAAITMRLEQHVDAPESTVPRAIQGSADFRGVMSVIVHYRDSALAAAQLKTPVHTAKSGQRFAGGFRADLAVHRHCDRSHGVEHVVAARKVQLEVAKAGAPATQAKFAGERSAGDLASFDIG